MFLKTRWATFTPRRDRIALDLSGYSPARIIPPRVTRRAKWMIITGHKKADRFCVTRLKRRGSIRRRFTRGKLFRRGIRKDEMRYRWTIEYRGTSFTRRDENAMDLYDLFASANYSVANKEAEYKEKVVKLPGKWQNYRYSFRLKIDKSRILLNTYRHH